MDLISRQAAIDVICKACSMEEDYHKCDGYPETSTWCDELVALRALPSAQPVVRTEMSSADTISRQAAIEALKHDEEYDEDIPNRADGVRDAIITISSLPSAQPEPNCSEIPNNWIPCSERLPSKEERKEWIDKNLGGIGYLYPCLVTRYSSINPDRTKNNPYVAKHYFDGEDFVNNGEEVCSEYIIAWMPLPEPYKKRREK